MPSPAAKMYMNKGMSEAAATAKAMGAKKDAFVSMKRTKKEKKETSSPVPYEGEDYPYGLELRFDEDCLDKLGMSEMPTVDDEVVMTVKARVRSVSSNDGPHGKSRCVTYQVIGVKK